MVRSFAQVNIPSSPAWRSPRTWLPLLIILVYAGGLLTWFAANDNRPPNDHDDFYTAILVDELPRYRAASIPERIDLLGNYFLDRGGRQLHPQLAQTWLYAALGTFGTSRFVFRLANLPFLLLLVFGTYAMARLYRGHALALLATWTVATLPILTNYSRKWDIQFHAAAWTPITLAVALQVLRAEPKNRQRWWIALGALQGVRCYTHPIVVPDILVIFGLLAALQLLRWREGIKRIAVGLLQLLSSVFVAATTGAWYFGYLYKFTGEPGYSFRNYYRIRQSYMDGGWFLEADLASYWVLVEDLLREIQWIHAMPAAYALLLPGFLLLPILLLPHPEQNDRSEEAEEARRCRRSTLFLLGVVGAQSVPVLLGTSNRAFLNDWLFLAPTVVVLSLATLQRLAWALSTRGRILASLWTSLLIAQGLFVTLYPLRLSAQGPDPIEQPQLYEGELAWSFTRSSSGRHYTTHHLVSHKVYPGEALSGVLWTKERSGSRARIGLADLSWDPQVGGRPGCRLGDPMRSNSFHWGPPEGMQAPTKVPSPWPFVFQGFDGVEWSSIDQPRSEDLNGELDGVVVRLWVERSSMWADDETPCRPVERLPPTLLRGAHAFLSGRKVTGDKQVYVQDPTGWLLGAVVDWTREPNYLGGAIIVGL